MARNRNIIRSESLFSLRQGDFGLNQVPIYSSTLIHQYVRLDIDHAVEFAETKDPAQRYLRAVAEAAAIVHVVASSDEFGGLLLEPQGSTIHAAIPAQQRYRETATAFALAVHELLQLRMSASHPCVTGWRITSDVGRTLVIAGRGVHGDQSLVSIGSAANRPAKYLYKELSAPEEERSLKRYFLALRDPESKRWMHLDLTTVAGRRDDRDVKEAALAGMKYDIHMIRSGSAEPMVVTADAHPVAPAGSPGSPTANEPEQHYGWVMRADLDGFTALVEACFDQDDRLDEVARWFARIMDSAAAFVDHHRESMVQLPWAGDNFTAAVVFGTKKEYDGARSARLVEHTLDFDDEMREVRRDNTWAYGVCGGHVHGNAVGNVFIGSIGFGLIRFLIGAGAGFARSLQAFGDIKPAGCSVEILAEDYSVLVDEYKSCFSSVRKFNGELSALFKESNAQELSECRDNVETEAESFNVNAAPAVITSVAVKPYASWHSKDSDSPG